MVFANIPLILSLDLNEVLIREEINMNYKFAFIMVHFDQNILCRELAKNMISSKKVQFTQKMLLMLT